MSTGFDLLVVRVRVAGIFNCLVGWKGKTVATRSASAAELGRLDRGADQTCQPTEARNHIIRQSDGTAYFVDQNLRRRWIPNGGTYNCLREVKGLPLHNNISKTKAESFANGPNMTCQAILVGPDGTSFHLKTSGTRHWIPDGGTFVCLEDRGVPVFRYNSWSKIDLITERPDDWAKC